MLYDDSEEEDGLIKHTKFEIVNKPLHQMGLKTQVQIINMQKREPLMKAVGKTRVAVFAPGPLGIQLADIGLRVLVTGFQNEKDGSKGQAELSGVVDVGDQIVGVGNRSCLGLNMPSLLNLIQTSRRPLRVEFQPLTSVRFPMKDRRSIFQKMDQNGTLEVCGDAYTVEFPEKFLGINVGNMHGKVVVSQFLENSNDELLEPVSLGDVITAVGTYDKESGKWTTHDCSNETFVELAERVRLADRPVRLTMLPTKVVVTKPEPCQVATKTRSSTAREKKTNKKEKKEKKESRMRAHCTKCCSDGPESAKFCWSCGAAISQAAANENVVGDLLGLGVEDGISSTEQIPPPALFDSTKNSISENRAEKEGDLLSMGS